MCSKSLLRKRDRRKLEEAQSGQITEITGFFGRGLEQFTAGFPEKAAAVKPI
jgi:hypothetical protein